MSPSVAPSPTHRRPSDLIELNRYRVDRYSWVVCGGGAFIAAFNGLLFCIRSSVAMLVLFMSIHVNSTTRLHVFYMFPDRFEVDLISSRQLSALRGRAIILTDRVLGDRVRACPLRDLFCLMHFIEIAFDHGDFLHEVSSPICAIPEVHASVIVIGNQTQMFVNPSVEMLYSIARLSIQSTDNLCYRQTSAQMQTI